MIDNKISLSKLFRLAFNIFLLGLLSITGYTFWYSSILKESFSQGVEAHLARAAQASSVESARTEIDSALSFINKTPRFANLLANNKQKLLYDGGGFQEWYQDLKDLRQVLVNIKFNSSLSEKNAALSIANRGLLYSNSQSQAVSNAPKDPDAEFYLLIAKMGSFISFSIIAFIFIGRTLETLSWQMGIQVWNLFFYDGYFDGPEKIESLIGEPFTQLNKQDLSHEPGADQ